MSNKTIFLELADDYYSMSHPRHEVSDTWGAAMSLAFDAAGVAYERCLDTALDYLPGAGGVEDIECEYRRNALMALSDGGLLTLCKFIDRVLDMLKRNDKSY